ncbi:nucleotidyltransferase domain-containing protein [Paenibacillus sp. MSJ-34]|uniref:nucleotidyltransferase domain-containing protein n=1 Tax=Paenibacillus sp. MSJ-34 TaxID=2841529 RepID=UPI001C1243D2|nr:nucleotidyltransferase domain-containing protein [Paenibacillus sp. MSJ-34]MBU5443101.1 nucleotidyltransferase domain-containing protein [Paenibacillus sp. MSJ-34]
MISVSEIIEETTKALQDAPGIVGIVLGGSRARGTHHPTSDIDIGIYYDESAGFDVRHIGPIAAKLDDEHRENLVSELGGWGPWVNGGGWLVVQGFHVDLIFRDVTRVAKVIDECLSGSVTANYHAGHPHAYLNVMYMGEISICNILSDPTGRIAKLQAKTAPYPKAVQDAIIRYFMFEASFSLMFADKNVDKDDISYVSGCCYRTISCLNQVLFAINNEYCINEKKAVATADRFAMKPHGYKKRIDRIVTLLSSNTGSAREGVDMLKDLVAETEKLLPIQTN